MFTVDHHWLKPTEAFRDTLEKANADAELLQLSIAKWEFIVEWLEAHPGEPLYNGGARTCALCRVYGSSLKCSGCPIVACTKDYSCYGTPYEDYTRLNTAAMRLDAAVREIEFLKEVRDGLV